MCAHRGRAVHAAVHHAANLSLLVRPGCGLWRAQLAAGATPAADAANARALVSRRYALDALPVLRLAFRRQWLLFVRNKAFTVFRLVQVRARTRQLAACAHARPFLVAAAQPLRSLQTVRIDCRRRRRPAVPPLREPQVVVMGCIIGSLFYQVCSALRPLLWPASLHN